MQSNAICDPMKMGELDNFPPEVLVKILENMSVRDVIKTMALNKHSYATITNLRHTIIPIILSITKPPEVIEPDNIFGSGSTWHLWVDLQPPAYQYTDTFKLLAKVTKSIKAWNFGDVLNATTTGENQRCVGCSEKTKWTEIRTGRPHCEKCAVWEFSPESFGSNGESYGIDWTVAAGAECVFINLAAGRDFHERQEQGEKGVRVPLIKVFMLDPCWLPVPLENEDDQPWIRWAFWILYLCADGVTGWTWAAKP